jgi:hypothetical protein
MPRIGALVVVFLLLVALTKFLLLPSVTTLDVSASTDRVQIDLMNDPTFDSESMALSDGLVCGDVLPSIDLPSSGSADLCQLAHRRQLYNTFNGHLELNGAQRVTIQRLREKELEIAIVSENDGGSITFHERGGATQSAKNAFVRVQRHFFDDGNIYVFVTRATKVVLGGTGGASGRYPWRYTYEWNRCSADQIDFHR